MKKAKHFLWLAVGILAVIGTFIGVFTYNTRGQAVLLDTSVSPDGSYQLSFFSVGEPDWPFGSAYGRISLTNDERKLSEAEIDLAQDGCQLCKENWSIIWREDCAEITLHASEQDDEHWCFYFDGQVEQSTYAAVSASKN